MKRILPTINTGIGNLPEKRRVNSRTCSRESFLEMSLYLEAMLPSARALFLNIVHTGVAIKNDKYDTIREYIERWTKVSFWHVISLHHCGTNFRVRCSIYTRSHQQQSKYDSQKQGRSSPPQLPETIF